MQAYLYRTEQDVRHLIRMGARVRGGYRVRIYVPYGEAWYPYMTRRLAERPANLTFLVKALAQELADSR